MMRAARRESVERPSRPEPTTGSTGNHHHATSQPAVWKPPNVAGTMTHLRASHARVVPVTSTTAIELMRGVAGLIAQLAFT